MISKLNLKILSNTFYQIIGKLLTSSLGFLASILLARHFGVKLFGEFNLIYIFLGIIGVFSDFGLATLLVREVAAKKADEEYISAVFSLRIVFLLLILIVSSVILPFFSYSPYVRFGIVIALLGNSFLGLSSIFWAVFQAKLDFLKMVLIQVLSSFLSTILIIIGIFGSFPFLYFVLAGAIGNFAGYFITKIVSGFKIKIYFDINIFRKILIDSWPIGLGVIVTTLFSKIDSLMISFFFNPGRSVDLGLYSASYKYFEVASVFSGFFQITTFPIISSGLRKKNFIFLYRKLFSYGAVISLVSTGGLFLLAKPLILILGKDYLPAVNSLKILSLALGVMVISGIWPSISVAGGRQKQFFYVSLSALIFNIFLNLLVVPKFSFIGASWTTFFSQIFISLGYFFIAREFISKKET